MQPTTHRHAVFGWRDAIWDGTDDCGLSPSARLVALALSTYMDADTLLHARPSVERLMRATGLGRTSVKASLGLLVASGWIVRTVQGGAPPGGKRRASEYRGVLRPGQILTGSECTPLPGQNPTGTGSPGDHHLEDLPRQDLGASVDFVTDERGYTYIKTATNGTAP